MNGPFAITLLSLCATGALSAQDAQVVEASFRIADVTNRETPPPVAPPSKSATLTAGVAAGVTAPADCHVAWSGKCKIGTREIAVAVASAAEGETLDALFIDLNADGKFGEGERTDIEVNTQTRGTRSMTRSAPVDIELQFGENLVAAQATFSQMDTNASVALSFPGILTASFELDGKERTLAIVDNDFDGRLGSAGDLWAVGRTDGRPQSGYAMMGMGEHCFEKGAEEGTETGTLVGIKVAGESIHVTTAAATAPVAADAAAQRVRAEHIWVERFDAEREGFVEARKLDTSRKLAAKPIQWQYVTFDEGVAMAKKSNKLLFVDVMAFWCVWCYRMDYYTYPDAEVAKFMSDNFIPVKLIQEQDLVGDYDRVMKGMLEAKGIPAMGVFDGEGKLLHKIGGWSAPEAFLGELKTAKGQ